MKRLSKPTIIALAVLVVAAVFILVGALDGQAVKVWQKAALICYECIGLG